MAFTTKMWIYSRKFSRIQWAKETLSILLDCLHLNRGVVDFKEHIVNCRTSPTVDEIIMEYEGEIANRIEDNWSSLQLSCGTHFLKLYD